MSRYLLAYIIVYLLPLDLFQHQCARYHKTLARTHPKKSGDRQNDDESSYSKSVSNLLPAARAGAGGVLKGFRRLDPKMVSAT